MRIYIKFDEEELKEKVKVSFEWMETRIFPEKKLYPSKNLIPTGGIKYGICKNKLG